MYEFYLEIFIYLFRHFGKLILQINGILKMEETVTSLYQTYTVTPIFFFFFFSLCALPSVLHC